MRRWVGVVVLAATGCPQDSVDNFGNGSLISDAASGSAVDAEAGVAPVSVLVRATSEIGTAVPAESVEVDVDGTATPVSLDEFGYGVVGQSSDGSVAGVPVAILSAPTLSLPLPRWRSVDETATAVVGGSAGFLAAADRKLWWTGPGLVDHVVADLRAPISGLRAVDVDADGTVDAVVWGGDSVVVLRGRPDGGAGFGAGVEAPGWTAVGAAVGDLDEDGDGDLVIVWDDGGDQVLQLWENDGDWAFSPADEREISGLAIDVEIAADRPDSGPAITVLIVGDEWRRFRMSNDDKLLVTGNNLTVDAVEGSRLHTPGDMTGDGVEELIVVPPRISGSPRELRIWELGEDRSTVLTVDVPGGWFASGDAQPDDVADLWMLREEPPLLQTLTPADGSFGVRDHGRPPAVGPVAVGQVDADPLPDLFVAGPDAWLTFVGAQGGDDLHWIPERGAVNRRDVKLQTGISPADVELGVDEFAGVVDDDGTTSVRLWTLREAGPVDAVTVDLEAGDGAAVDFVACGSDGWALFADEVVHANLESGEIVGRLGLSGGKAIACRDADAGVIAAVALGSGVQELRGGAGDAGVSPGVAEDVAFGESGPVGCAGPCAVWPGWPAGEAMVQWENGAVVVQVDGDSTTFAGGPDFAVQDADDDGELELWFKDDRGLVQVVRQSASGPVVDVGLQVSFALDGAPQVGSGVSGADALWFTDSGDLCWTP